MPDKRITIDVIKKTTGFPSTRFIGTVFVYERPAMPGIIILLVTFQENEMLKFKLVLPAPGAADVVKRELSVKIADADAVLAELAADALEADGYEGQDDDAVEVSLVDIDDAGNRSEARVQTFTLADTIAPPVPGEIGLVVTAEV